MPTTKPNDQHFGRHGVMLAALIWGIAPLAAYGRTTVRTHTVVKILQGGAVVAASSRTTLRFKDGRLARGVSRGDVVPDGTRIETPAGVEVVVQSTDANSTTSIRPSAAFAFLQTGIGEISRLIRGSAFFEVIHDSLGFFVVLSGSSAKQINASVSGTHFGMNATAGAVTVEPTSGAVNVSETGDLLVTAEIKRVPRCRKTVRVPATSSKPAAFSTRPSEVFWTFETFALAQRFFEQQFSAAAYAQDVDTERSALTNIGQLELSQGNRAGALRSYENARSISQSIGDIAGVAEATSRIGLVQASRLRYVDALAADRNALSLYRTLGDLRGIADVLANIGNVQLSMNILGQAAKTLNSALSISEQFHDPGGQAKSELALGLVARQVVLNRRTKTPSSRDFEVSLRLLSVASYLYGQAGDSEGVAQAEYSSALVLIDARAYDEAAPRLRASLGLFGDLSDGYGQIVALTALGSTDFARGNFEAARTNWDRAKQINARVGDAHLGRVLADNLKRLTGSGPANDRPPAAPKTTPF